MKRILTCCLTLILSKSMLFGQDIKNQVQAIADQYKAVGVAYVVVQDGKVIMKDALGKRSIENNTPLEVERHPFRIASISKSFPSTAFVYLLEIRTIS